MSDTNQSQPVVLDRGTESIVGGVVVAIAAVIVYAKLRSSPGIAWCEVAGLGVISLAAFWIGFTRRRYAIANGGTLPAPRIQVPEQPFVRVARSAPREPMVLLLIGLFVTGNGIGIGIAVVAANGPLAVALLVGSLITGGGARIVYVGVRRLLWFREYEKIVGEPPW